MTTRTHESTDGGQQLLLGKMMLERGLITPDQLREALADRARSVSEGSAKPLGIILVAKGFLSDTQLVQLLAEQANRPGSSSGSIPAFSPAPLPPVISPASPSTRLGKYELVNELGRGGMGVVYEAIDTQLNRKVALKLMLTSPSADPKEVSLDEERFVQEAQLSAKLKHPNIVTVYEAGVLEGRRFLAMEMIEGQAFSDWRRESGASLRQQLEVLRDVALAVHHAHEQGILHRDLKPRNVLIGANNRAFVTDFGLAKSLGTAKAAHSLTGSGAVVGTPAYMSPEQAQGNERVDWRTDIWSLGVMLYECLTGRTPFTGESPIEILMKVVKDPVPPPSTIVEGGAALALDRAVENICMKALAKKDRDRYVTARAFAEDLSRWLNGEQVRINAPKTTKRPRPVAYIVGAAAGVILVTGIVWYLIHRPSVEADLIQARRAMKVENYLEAATYFGVVLRADPKNAEAIEGARLARELDGEKKKREEDRLRQQLDASRREEEEAKKKASEAAEAEANARTQEEKNAAMLAKARADERLRLAEDANRRADEELKRKLALKPDSIPVRKEEDGWGGSLNLLGLIDFPQGVVWGTWGSQDRLISEREGFARVEIPYEPLEEYDLRAVFTRLSGAGEVCLILNRPGGRSFALELGGWKNTSNGFQAYKGLRAPEHAAALRCACALENHHSYKVEVQVRRDGVTAKLDGRPILEKKIPLDDLSLDPCWALRTPGSFGLGSNESSVMFQRFDLREGTGRGRRGQPSAPPQFKPSPISPVNLKPGLVGVYFHGSNFEVPELSQIDPAPQFDWGTGPAWKGGPADIFSIRWAGYLYIPKSGHYAFSLASDDGARLFLDGNQIISNWRVNAGTARSTFLDLSEGYHAIEVEYFEDIFQASVGLSWTDSADGEPVPIPPRHFFHDGAAFKPITPLRFPEAVGVLTGHQNSISAAAFHPDGRFLATVSEDHKVKLWNLATRKDQVSLVGHTKGVLSLAYSPDGSVLATGGADRRIRLWQGETGAEIRILEGHSDFVVGLAFSPDGKILASSSSDRTVKLWDTRGWTVLRTLSGHAGSVETLSFSPEGKTLATGSVDHTIRLWDVATGEEKRTLAGHPDAVQSVAYSPDGGTVASAGWDGLIKLWDPATGQPKLTLSGHNGQVLGVAFSPDGKLLASGGSDCMVRLWDPSSGREVRTLPGHIGRVTALAFAKEGRLLASVSFDMTARLWDVRSW